jgi:hypothetical protein
MSMPAQRSIDTSTGALLALDRMGRARRASRSTML